MQHHHQPIMQAANALEAMPPSGSAAFGPYGYGPPSGEESRQADLLGMHRRLEMRIAQIASECQRLRNLNERLFGGSPPEEMSSTPSSNTPAPSGLISAIRQHLDMLDTLAEVLVQQINQLHHLG